MLYTQNGRNWRLRIYNKLPQKDGVQQFRWTPAVFLGHLSLAGCGWSHPPMTCVLGSSWWCECRKVVVELNQKMGTTTVGNTNHGTFPPKIGGHQIFSQKFSEGVVGLQGQNTVFFWEEKPWDHERKGAELDSVSKKNIFPVRQVGSNKNAENFTRRIRLGNYRSKSILMEL